MTEYLGKWRCSKYVMVSSLCQLLSIQICGMDIGSVIFRGDTGRVELRALKVVAIPSDKG